MKTTADQRAQYEGIYRARTADLDRPDTPTLTLKHLGAKGLLRRGGTLLDVGCGIGKDVRLAVTRHRLARATGIDTSQQVIEDAVAVTQAQVARRQARRIEFITGDIQQNADRLGRYGFVLATSVIHLLGPGEKQAFLEDLASHKDDGGMVVVATKTTASGDIRPVDEGGKSVEQLGAGPGFELHRSDDGLNRYYYEPEAFADSLRQTELFSEVQVETVRTPYGSVADCEFAIAIAK